jgi:hypothetical protein
MSPTPRTASVYRPGLYESDRRLHQRYAITLDVEYKLLDGRHVQRQGFGRTVNMSSGGVLLDLGAPLPSRGTIQLSIRWPFLLDGSIPLKLMMRGNIVRVDGNSIAVEITEHEFRTVGHDQLKKRRQH